MCKLNFAKRVVMTKFRQFSSICCGSWCLAKARFAHKKHKKQCNAGGSYPKNYFSLAELANTGQRGTMG